MTLHMPENVEVPTELIKATIERSVLWDSEEKHLRTGCWCWHCSQIRKYKKPHLINHEPGCHIGQLQAILDDAAMEIPDGEVVYNFDERDGIPLKEESPMDRYNRLVETKNCVVCNQAKVGCCTGLKTIYGCPNWYEFEEDLEFKARLEGLG